jgi:hypothetical protein
MVPVSLDQQNTKSPGDSHQDFSLLDQSLILELIPAAALVYRRTDDQILSANRKFFDLTAFTLNALQDLSLNTLIPAIWTQTPPESKAAQCACKLPAATSFSRTCEFCPSASQPGGRSHFFTP